MLAGNMASIAMHFWTRYVPSMPVLSLERRFALAGNCLGQHEQFMRLAQHDALPPALDQAALLPSGEDTADGMQRGAGHLRDILAADRKIDLNAMLHLASGLFRQSQQ